MVNIVEENGLMECLNSLMVADQKVNKQIIGSEKLKPIIELQPGQDGFDSYVKYISKFSILNEGDIKMAFASDQSDNYILTVVAVCHFVAEQACRDYAAINGDEY